MPNNDMLYTARLDRALILLSGENVEDFLSGLITNNLKADISYAALLTPQGKIIADFFVTKVDGGLMIDTPEKFTADLMKRLKMYKLRAKINLDISELSVYAQWGGMGDDSSNGHADPRNTRLGRRIIATALETNASAQDYDSHRLSLGIVDSAADFDSVKMFPADANMDLLGGVDYKKGCFIGQEVVSRMHRKTSVRKRMRGVTLSGNASAGDAIMAGDIKVGTLNHVRGERAIALIRLGRLEGIEDNLMVNDKPAIVLPATMLEA